MRLRLGWVLIFLFATSASARSAFASTEHDNKQAAKLKMEVDSLPQAAFVKVKLKDRSKIKGELIARSEEDFELGAPAPATVSYIEAKSIAEDPAGQSVPGNTQKPPAHHHRIVKYVVIIAVILGLTVALASLDR